MGFKFFLVCLLTFPFVARASTSGLLVEEVIAQSADPKGYEWMRMPLLIEAGYTIVNEANIFESRSYSLGALHSLNRSWFLRGNVRRTETRETQSSKQMALTIYSQAGQPSRYEVGAGVGFVLLDGRSSTPLSPCMTDIGHMVAAIGGVQYNLFDSKPVISGMRPIEYRLAAELGLRFQIFLPRSFGAAVEWIYARPLTSPDAELVDWQRFGGSLSWSFGS